MIAQSLVFIKYILTERNTDRISEEKMSRKQKSSEDFSF